MNIPNPFHNDKRMEMLEEYKNYPALRAYLLALWKVEKEIEKVHE